MEKGFLGPFSLEKLNSAFTGGGIMAIEDIFLTYSNHSLRDNPEYLYRIFQVIGDNIEIDLNGANRAIEIICELSQYIDPKEYQAVIDEKYDTAGFYNPIEHPAKGAVVGDRCNYYFEFYRLKGDEIMINVLEAMRERTFNCELRKINEKILGKDMCEKGYVQKCYECHQLDFINTLQDITNGKEYSEIKDIDMILYDSSLISTHRTIRSIDQSKYNTSFKEELTTCDVFDVGYRDYMNRDEANTTFAFCNYLNSIAYFSLTEFILHNDRRKLKKCPYCEGFFIAKDIKRTSRCYSEQCNKEFERDKKRKQREKDPVKYGSIKY